VTPTLRLASVVLAIVLAFAWTARAADRVVMGTGIDPSYGQAYIAADTGIFKKHGLDVEVKLFSSGSASTASLIPGDIQVSMTSVPAGALHHAIAPKVVLIGLTDILTGYNGCAAQADIKQLSDLRGRKVGIAKGTTSELSASQALQRVGMAMTDITPVYVEPPEMLAALLRKDIDAFFVWEPWITRAKFAGGNTVNLLKGVEFFLVHNHLVMDKDWVAKNIDVAVRFTKAIKEAGEFVHEKPDESARIIARYLKLDEPLVKALLPKTNFMMVLDDTTMAYLKADVDSLIAGGKIKAPFDYAGYVYPDVLKAIDPNLVTYKALPQ
jgi:NitT/TauT family transport system substrate-binding protein